MRQRHRRVLLERGTIGSNFRYAYGFYDKRILTNFVIFRPTLTKPTVKNGFLTLWHFSYRKKKEEFRLEARYLKIPEHSWYREFVWAVFLSIIAYPTNPLKRRSFTYGLIALSLHRRAQLDPDWAGKPQTMIPDIALPDIKEFKAIVDRGWFQIVHRKLHACEIARAYIFDFVFKKIGENSTRVNDDGADKSPIKGIRFSGGVTLREFDPLNQEYIDKNKPVSINTLALSIAQKINNTSKSETGKLGKAWTRENVLSRIWTPSKSALPLLLGLRDVMAKKGADDRAVEIEDFFENEWTEYALDRSEFYEALIIGQNLFRIREDQFLKLVV
jgi:hypothetical protein